jgi:hypothetical protein
VLVADNLFEPIIVGNTIGYGLVIKKIEAAHQTPVIAMGHKTRDVLKRTFRVLAAKEMKAQSLEFTRGLPLYLDIPVPALGIEAHQLNSGRRIRFEYGPTL